MPITPSPAQWGSRRFPISGVTEEADDACQIARLIVPDEQLAGSTPVVYPHYWWLKNVAHPEFQAKGPPEYDLATVELWLHKGQESARRVAGNLIKGQKKGRGVTGSLIYEHLLKNNMLVSCLGFADGLEIQKKGILVFRKFFNGKGLYLWNSVAEDLRDGLQVSFLAELGDEVVMGWRWLGHIWDREDPAARFPS